MDKIKLVKKIKQSNLDYNSLYEKINVVDKEIKKKFHNTEGVIISKKIINYLL